MLGEGGYLARRTITFALVPAIATVVWYSMKSLFAGKLEFGSIDYGSRLFMCVVFAFLGFVEATSRWKSQENSYSATIESIETTQSEGVKE